MATSCLVLNEPVSVTAASGSVAESMKYRQSCDRCQNNKVRCSRDKPTCKRCEKRKAICVYSPLKRIGRPRKVVSEDAISEDGDDNGDDDGASESMIRVNWAVSPDNSASLRASGGCQSNLNTEDSQRMDSNLTCLTNSQLTPSSASLVLPPNSNDGLLRSAVDSWIMDYQLSAASQAQSPSHSRGNRAGAGMNTLPDGPNCAHGRTPSCTLEDQPVADCYITILTQTIKLEQALVHTKLAPPVDLVLEAERDFCALQHRLFTCTGHGLTLPLPGNPELHSHLPQSSTKRHHQPCLSSDQRVFFGLILLAERVIGMLEDIFRLAAQSAQNTDKGNDLIWSETPSLVTGLSARRLQRSFRSVLQSPCVAPVVEADRDLRIGDFEVQDKAKSEAMKRILRLRVHRMLDGLQDLEGVRRSRETGERERSQSLGGPLDWGGSGTLLGNMGDTLVDDLIRRVESMQGAMVLF